MHTWHFCSVRACSRMRHTPRCLLSPSAGSLLPRPRRRPAPRSQRLRIRVDVTELSAKANIQPREVARVLFRVLKNPLLRPPLHGFRDLDSSRIGMTNPWHVHLLSTSPRHASYRDFTRWGIACCRTRRFELRSDTPEPTMKEHVLQVLSTCGGLDDPKLSQGTSSAACCRYDDSGKRVFRRFVHQGDVTCGVSYQSAVRYTGRATACAKTCVGNGRFGSQSDGAALRTSATSRIRMTRAPGASAPCTFGAVQKCRGRSHLRTQGVTPIWNAIHIRHGSVGEHATNSLTEMTRTLRYARLGGHSNRLILSVRIRQVRSVTCQGRAKFGKAS